MVRFLHTADWQIGKPYGEVGEEAKRWRLQQERIEAIGRIAAVVQRRQAAFVLVAGDLFDSPGVPPPPRRWWRCSRPSVPSRFPCWRFRGTTIRAVRIRCGTARISSGSNSATPPICS